MALVSVWEQKNLVKTISASRNEEKYCINQPEDLIALHQIHWKISNTPYQSRILVKSQ